MSEGEVLFIDDSCLPQAGMNVEIKLLMDFHILNHHSSIKSKV